MTHEQVDAPAIDGLSGRGADLGFRAGGPTPLQSVIGNLALAGSVVGIGASVIFIRRSEVDASASLTLRTMFAAAILGPWVRPRRLVAAAGSVTGSRISRRDLVLLAICSVLVGADLLANSWAVNLTSITSAVLLSNLTPAFVLLVAVCTGRRVSWRQAGAVVLAIAGAAMLMSTDRAATVAPGLRLLGDGISLASAALYGFCLVMTKDLADRVPAVVILFANSLITALLVAPIAFATSDRVFPATAAGYALMFGYAVVTQLLGHGLLAVALSTVDTTVASVSVLLRPVVSMGLGWAMLGESLSPTQVVGGVVVLGALVWFELGATPRVHTRRGAGA
jgi:drug/metabolite transporter (DMT)-like permease